MDILNDLREVYKQEWWHTVKLSDEELDKYHQRLLDQGNILYLWDKSLVAYIEFWRITEEQLEEIKKDDGWSGYCNNITDGDICFVANIWIRPEYRGDKYLDRLLKNLFLERHKDCKHFVWKRNKKGKQQKLFTYRRK